MLVNFLINLRLFLANLFKGGDFYHLQVSNVHWIAHKSYDKVLKDYYDYLQRLLLQSLDQVNEPCIVSLDCAQLKGSQFLLPFRSIALQIEHTLVKPGARDSENAPTGLIPISVSDEKYLVRLANYEHLKDADLVFEYSRINQFNVEQVVEFSSYSKKTFCISPALYALRESSLVLEKERHLGTITLFGNPNEPRRKGFLVDLQSKKVKSKNINNVFSGIEDVYRQTKILINIHQTDHHDTLEELRVLPALRCGVIVISEKSPLVEQTGYSKYIIWGELSELPGIILDIQNNYEEWHQKIFQHSGFRNRMNRISKRNELVASKAMDFLNTYNRDSTLI